MDVSPGLLVEGSSYVVGSGIAWQAEISAGDEKLVEKAAPFCWCELLVFLNHLPPQFGKAKPTAPQRDLMESIEQSVKCF